MEKQLAECQRVIGYHFANPTLLEVALTHSSLRTPDRECNERLEFLGDSVLGLVITEELYRLLPDQAEGELTRIKSAVVSRGALYRASTALGLARFAEFARGVERRRELPVSVTANLVESIIGAIYLDAGYFPAREFVLRNLGEELEDVLNDRGAKNYKSLLQHTVQQRVGAAPTYRMVEEEGPHHRKQFTAAAVVRGQEWGRGGGATKKEAEQEAARRALDAWRRRGRGRRRRPGRPAAEAKAAAAPEPEAAVAETPKPRGRRRAAPTRAAKPAEEKAAPAEAKKKARGRRRPARAAAAADGPPPEPAPRARRGRKAEAPAEDLAAHDRNGQGDDAAAAPPRPSRRRPRRETRKEAPKAEPAPAEPPAGRDAFAEGLDVDEEKGAPKAAKAPKARKTRPKSERPARRVRDRRKAPPSRVDADEKEDDAFDAGL